MKIWIVTSWNFDTGFESVWEIINGKENGNFGTFRIFGDFWDIFGSFGVISVYIIN